MKGGVDLVFFVYPEAEILPVEVEAVAKFLAQLVEVVVAAERFDVFSKHQIKAPGEQAECRIGQTLSLKDRVGA